MLVPRHACSLEKHGMVWCVHGRRDQGDESDFWEPTFPEGTVAWSQGEVGSDFGSIS